MSAMNQNTAFESSCVYIRLDCHSNIRRLGPYQGKLDSNINNNAITLDLLFLNISSIIGHGYNCVYDLDVVPYSCKILIRYTLEVVPCYDRGAGNVILLVQAVWQGRVNLTKTNHVIECVRTTGLTYRYQSLK